MVTADKRQESTSQRDERYFSEARLQARPTRLKSPAKAIPHGLHKLGLGPGRDGLIYVPSNYRADQPAPLVLMLHGAGGQARNGLNPLYNLADKFGLILLAVDSRGRTWDIILGDYGPDVAFINRALAHTFEHYAIDPKRIAIEGFSDGASYSLSLGLSNGDLFSHVIAFSPGFMAPTQQEGAPHLFISHGKKDGVLPIDRCSRTIVPRLRRARYELRYREFDGPHTVPPEIAREAMHWFTSKPVAGK